MAGLLLASTTVLYFRVHQCVPVDAQVHARIL